MGRIRCQVCGLKKRQVGLGELNLWECIDCWCKRKNCDMNRVFSGSQKIEKDIDFPFADWNMKRALRGLE